MIGDNLRMDYTASATPRTWPPAPAGRAGVILASEATWRLVEGYVRGERSGRSRSGSGACRRRPTPRRPAGRRSRADSRG
jgi:hypothetical protein